MTVMTGTPPRTGADHKATGTVPAPWPLRAAVLAVDILPGAAVLAVTALVALSVPRYGGWWWVCASTGAVAILLTAANRVLLAVVCGNSLGRRLVETRRPSRDLRRLVAAVVLTAALLCALGGTISYTVVRQHDRSVAVAGAQVAAQGPRMVAQMLSYRPETIQADFDHARSLATDKYGAELSALQQAVQKSGPVRNEYWVSNSAVLDATPERATMLMFLQGERGASPDQRYISASVRATFVASGAAGWRVDDIAVIAGTPAAEAHP